MEKISQKRSSKEKKRFFNFQQLIKSTNDLDPEYQNLVDARDAMSDVNHYINEVKRDHEAIEIIRSIERSIVDLAIVRIFLKKKCVFCF